ncbi:hypothetical protein BJ875DRAFT_474850 [Amylocarpus encephaloides]|uniref:Extracellular membrane protein CFEM domain-containing protein n=1 Tax=Amylocarpus encephaloides TaxID=45428 RepID=A0A9P7Y934_9HELO|nr:hypothetical protein BJ875DRAFT_474850 [Amylocarpus encephaloides]
MKISSVCLVLLTAEVYGVAAREAHYTATVTPNGEGYTLAPQNSYGGWVNPEDLTPMPQCIAQQDQSTWLSTMTKCTSKRCTRHFAFICTHYQWLTQLSCLSIGFSSNVIEGYLPYCGRSVLAKAQLYLWIRKITGRTWLVDVGDANELQNLSPASLTKGYAAVDVIYKAPICLTGSVSALSMEPFQHVVASCSFTSTAQHTGNAARPWEYSESLRSMIALDFETVGYNLAGRSIRYGDYFDKECFCGAFAIDPEKEPCLVLGQLGLTKERLWINATCGAMSLPDNWTDTLKTTEFAYIPTEDWHWPMCVADMPKQVIELTDHCATDACEVDSSGYCKVKRAVDKACFCRNISYDSCGGSCQIFETRIDYIKWLHDLCGNVQDWHGLPDNWRQLAAPTPLELIPWRWTLKPSSDSNITNDTRLGSARATEKCASNEWKLGSFALVNIATFLAAFLSQRTFIHQIARGFLWHPRPRCWFFKGTLIAALQLVANRFNVFLVQTTPGYEDVPVIELMLLWCSMPRLAWLPILLNFPAAASFLFAEMILQCLSSYCMVMTASYGLEHGFYRGGMERVERGGPAKIMYAGALIWAIIIISLVLFKLVWATPRMDKSRGSEETPLTSSEGEDYAVYGTFSVKGHNNWVSQKLSVELYATVKIILLLWIAQWLFWAGFIGLSSEEYVFMHILSPC